MMVATEYRGKIYIVDTTYGWEQTVGVVFANRKSRSLKCRSGSRPD